MITPKRFYIGQPSTTTSSVYSVPLSTKALVKNMIFTNTTPTKSTITLHFVPSGGSVGAQNRIISSYPVEANDTVVIDIASVLEANDTIQISQGTSGAITVAISGVEVA